MQQDQVRQRTQRVLVLLILFSAVPLAVAVVLLQIAAPLGNPLSGSDLALLAAAIDPAQIVSGALTYSTAALIHFFVCLTALALAILVLRNVPDVGLFLRTGLLLAGGVALTVPLIAMIAGRNAVAINLTYFATEDLLGHTGAIDPIIPGLPLTPLVFWIYGPTLLGIVAVAMIAAAASAQLSLVAPGPADSEEAKEAQLCLVYGHIKQCAYMLSLVLVTSTVGASIYFHLPLKGLDAANKALKGPISRLDSLAGELSLFWGAVFTLTLIAAVGIPLLLVQRQFRDFLQSLKPVEHAEATRERLAKGGYLSDGRQQVKLIFPFIAPLASGPAASLLQGLLAS